MISNLALHPGLELTLVDGTKEVFFSAGIGSIKNISYEKIPYDVIGKVRQNALDFAKEHHPALEITRFNVSYGAGHIDLNIKGVPEQHIHLYDLKGLPSITCTAIVRTASEGAMEMGFSIIRGGSGNGYTRPAATIVLERLEDIREALRNGSELIEDGSKSYEEQLSVFKEEWVNAVTREAKHRIKIASEFLKAGGFERRFFPYGTLMRAQQKLENENPKYIEPNFIG